MRKFTVLSLLLFFVLTPVLVYAAPNKVYMVAGTRVIFNDTTGTAIDLTSLAAGAGVYSAQYDKGAGSQPYIWGWDATFTLNGTPSATGDVIEVYVVRSNNTQRQGNLGATKATLATGKRLNLSLMGTVIVDGTGATPVLQGAGRINDLVDRYFSIAVWNATSLAFTASTAVHIVGMTPYSQEIQANNDLPDMKFSDVAALPVPSWSMNG